MCFDAKHIDLKGIPFPVNRLLRAFMERISTLPSGLIQGVYITGSIPMQDFHSNKSDIDFLVFCGSVPNNSTINQLKEIHRGLAKKFVKPDLSGHYLCLSDLKMAELEKTPVLTFHEGVLKRCVFKMAIIQLCELKSHGITIFGTSAQDLPIVIEPRILSKFLFDNLNTYWRKWIDQHTYSLKHQLLLYLFPRFTEWAILGILRQLYTLQTGKIVSKKVAGEFGLSTLPEEFHWIVQKALEIRADNRSYPIVKSYALRPSGRRVTETLNCANFMIAYFNQLYGKNLPRTI